MIYEMDLVDSDRALVTKVVNRGIDAYLQAITQSTFELYDDKFSGTRLKCTIRGKDMGVLLRRLLELEEKQADLLAQAIAFTIDIDEISLLIDDEFCITRYNNNSEYVSFFDDQYWEDLELDD